jgi:glutamate synthase (NADPH/NADH) small chain
MADIDYKSRGSILNPLRTLSFLTRKPVTVPLEPREAAASYRGFHLNDWEKCIGCSTCQKICDNEAITMVHIPDLPADPLKGVRAQRPAIDYGRCCWCGLCVDVCPSASLSLSREYIHTCEAHELDSYFVLPDPNGMHGRYFGHGWQKSADSDLVDLERQASARPCRNRGRPSGCSHLRSLSTATTPSRPLSRPRAACSAVCATMPARRTCTRRNTFAPSGSRISRRRSGRSTAPTRLPASAAGCARGAASRPVPSGCAASRSIGVRGEPVAIRWLKRYAMDAVGHERVREIAIESRGDFISGRRVAVIGAGPAGLTAAADLARAGHRVTVYEALPEPGGMMRYGMPAYRLPYARIDDDVDVIRAMGVEIRCNTRIGKDFSLEQLQQEHDAVLVCSAVDLLRRITLDEPLTVPKSAVVIGGGNVAMDIARSMARLQIREHGRASITLTALEDAGHMLADPVEIREAHEEGITILPARGPKECRLDGNGGLQGLVTVKVLSIFDEAGRFAPRYDESDIQLHEADMVIEAIGQMADTSLLGDELTERLEWHRGRLQVDDGGRTSEHWLWAAGDLVSGPDVIHAVADGHRVAASMETSLGMQVEETQ